METETRKKIKMEFEPIQGCVLKTTRSIKKKMGISLTLLSLSQEQQLNFAQKLRMHLWLRNHEFWVQSFWFRSTRVAYLKLFLVGFIPTEVMASRCSYQTEPTI